jgi:histidinol-phosphate/aromatic aminotransferase/cobyric acid decarboxylase-like protein
VSKPICDFSVTTNALGPVPSALEATKRLLEDVEIAWTSPRGGDVKAILEEERDHPSERLASAPAVEHYPPRSDTELEQLTAAFLRPDAAAPEQLIFGNGASELIDLLARAAPDGPYCLNPHVKSQYMEYQRACRNAGRLPVDDPKEASLICLVNPNNPTGDFLERPEMETWIEEHAAPGSWVLVDESMLFWAGPDWHTRGVSTSFMDRMAKRHIQIFLVQSWTKIFACTGIRIGSVLCPTVEKSELLQSLQVPWSVTVFARTYLKAALQDTEYLERTWRTTPHWRANMVTRLQRLYPSWQFLGEPWLSWVWIDTGDAAIAESVYKASLQCGCPVRHAASGYDRPTVVRLAVRRPHDFSVLYQVLLQRECYSKSNVRAPFGTYADVHPSVVEGVRLVHIDDLQPHEQVLQDRADALERYVKALPVKILPAIIVDAQYQVVLDGHHRLNLFRKAGMHIVPVVSVNYDHEDILVNPPEKECKDIQKETVINTALKGATLAPKSTQHMVRSRSGALLPLIVLAPQIAELSNVGSAAESH